jgi:hypothetical protein
LSALKSWLGLYEGKNADVYITGSNTNLLSSEFTTLLNPDSAIVFGTPFANPLASVHCPLRLMNHKVRLGKVQCTSARSLCEIRPKPIAEFGFKKESKPKTG